MAVFNFGGLAIQMWFAWYDSAVTLGDWPIRYMYDLLLYHTTVTLRDQFDISVITTLLDCPTSEQNKHSQGHLHIFQNKHKS